MRSSNFEFIRPYLADLADDAAAIEGTFHCSVGSAIDLLRTFGQRLLQHLIEAKNKPIRDSANKTYEVGHLLRVYESLVPTPQRARFQELQTVGNLQHEPRYQPTLREDRLLQIAWELACWVGKQLGWRNIPSQFNPPPKGGHEFDEMRRSMVEALQRAADAERPRDVSGWICEDQRTLSVPANFVGREFVFGKIKQFLASSEFRVLVIQGQPGRGKSAIVQKFVSEIIPRGITPFVFCFNDQSSQGEPKRWVRHLFASVIQNWQLSQPDRSIDQADLEELVQQLRNRIVEVTAKHGDDRFLFVIDAVDEAGPAEKAVVSFLTTDFPKTVQVIVTARPDHVSLPSSSTNGRSTIQVLDLDDPDLWNNHQADGRSFVLATMPHLEPPTIEKVVQLGNGNFLVLREICHALQAAPADRVAHQLHELSELSASDGDFYTVLLERSWKRLERLDANLLDTIENVAMLLANACAPLSERIIRGTLSLRRADWVKVQQHFGEYLKRSPQPSQFDSKPNNADADVVTEDAAESVSAFRLFHQSFEGFVRKHLKNDLAESNSQLADYCLEQLKKRKPSYEYAYALRFGPRHLIRAAKHDPNRWIDVEELLTDITFLEAKTLAGLVFELADDLTSAWRAMPHDRPFCQILKLLDEAVRRDIHFIARHADDYPQGLSQCVLDAMFWLFAPTEYYDREFLELYEIETCEYVPFLVVKSFDHWRGYWSIGTKSAIRLRQTDTAFLRTGRRPFILERHCLPYSVDTAIRSSESDTWQTVSISSVRRVIHCGFGMPTTVVNWRE